MPPPEKASAMTVEPSSPPSVMNFGVGGGVSEPTVFMGPTSLGAQPQASIKAAATSAPAKFNLIIPPPLRILHSRQKYLTLHRCRKTNGKSRSFTIGSTTAAGVLPGPPQDKDGRQELPAPELLAILVTRHRNISHRRLDLDTSLRSDEFFGRRMCRPALAKYSRNVFFR